MASHFNEYDAFNVPPEFRPLGAWAYFAYSVLFSIPLIGLILLIIFSFSDANINRRNFARSYLIGLAVFIVLTIVLVLTGTLARAINTMDAEYLQNLMKSMPKA